MKILISLIIILAFSSCDKIEDQYTSIIGDYEWTYTQTGQATYLTNTEITDRFGIRITENGKLFLYQNGKKLSKHDIRNVEEFYNYTNNQSVITFTIEGNPYPITYRNGALNMSLFPFKINGENTMGYNHFIKH